MKKHLSTLKYVLRSGAIALAGVVLLSVFLTQFQMGSALQRQRANAQLKLDIATRRMTQNAVDYQTDWATYDEFSLAKLETMAYVMDSMEGVAPDLAAYAKQWDLEVLYLCDEQGKVLDAYGGTAASMQEANLTKLLEGRVYDAVGDLCFFKVPLKDGRLLVGGRQAAELFTRQDARLTEAHALQDIAVGETGYIAAVNIVDGVITYAKDETLIGQSASALGLDTSAQDGQESVIRLDGKEWYVRYHRVDEDTLFAAMVSQDELLDATFTPVRIALAVFAFAVFMMILYSAFIRHDIATGRIESDVRSLGKLRYDKNLAQKLRGVLLMGVAAVFAVSWYGQSLSAISRQRSLSEDTLAAVQEMLDTDSARIAELTEEYRQEYSGRTENIAWALQMNPALVSDEHLTAMAEKAQALSIWVFNRQGRAVATSSVYKDFVLGDDPESQSYAFWDVVKGYKPLLVQELRENDASGRLMQYVGAQRLDAPGMVQLGLTPSYLEARLQTTGLAHTLGSAAVENEGFLFAVDMTSGQFSVYPKEQYVGRAAADYGLTEAALTDGYIGHQTIDGADYFLCCHRQGNQLICVATPTAAVNASSAQAALMVALASLLVLLIIFLMSVLAHPNTTVAAKAQPGGKYFEATRADGTRQISQTATSRWSDTAQRWSDMLAGQKITLVAGAALTLIALVVMLYIASCRGRYDASSLLSFILSKRWEYRLNLFSVSYVLIVLLEVCVISTLLRRGILAVCRNLGSRGETVGRLLGSFIKYVAVIGTLFYGLTFFGFDSSTLLASAGILTLIVGLGAQALVSDILAGIFIVFEGEFQVGDIVDIGGWTGEVQEIGIRTTKVRNSGDNVKIFRNSAVAGVVNMTKQLSYALISVTVVHGESLEKVENIIKAELDVMRKNLPGIVGGPYFKGITAISNSSVTVQITAQCEEAERAALESSLMREIKLALIRNGIDIG